MHDAVGGVLLESTGGSDEEVVKEFCKTLYNWLTGSEEEAGKGEGPEAKSEGAKLLDAPVHLSSKLKITGGCGYLLSFTQTVRT